MYTIVLAAFLTTGNAAPGQDIREDIRELQKSIDEVRKEQAIFRFEELKQTIAGLRQRLLDEKLDELRRDIRDLRYEEMGYGVLPAPVPLMPSAQRATISLQVPAGAVFFANDREISLLSPAVSFVTPPLEPGRDYYYDFKVNVLQDGKTITRIKRVTVRAGAVVRLGYEDMELPR
ncbi:MAG TPA: TIGR03000 domain-containing protein [Gemmataceae bacterium]|nr:TIGR03000 domain-containing protein [Gemmataceae bacterium]